MDLIVSVAEARNILGQISDDMSDEQIIETVKTLDVLAVEALKSVERKRKADAFALANLIYDIYKDKKSAEKT